MNKLTILITGATDGIGLETAKKLKLLGHHVIIHGRSETKIQSVVAALDVDAFKADFSDLLEVKSMADAILKSYQNIDVLINNAGVFKAPNTKTESGHDLRFVVNTFAPYILTQKLLPLLKNGRVVNVSSAAQSSVSMQALFGETDLTDFEAYAQSKLAVAMWSRHLSKNLASDGITVIAVNPASFLSTKMVKEGFNNEGKDINIGVNILTSLALDNEHSNHSGEYYDNDIGAYAPLQLDGLDDEKAKSIATFIEGL